MHYVYHPHHAPIIVSPAEYPTYLADGWYDTPDKFPSKNLANGVKPEPVAVAEEVAPPVATTVVAINVVPKNKGGRPARKDVKVQLGV